MRSKAEIEDIRSAIYNVVASERPMTVRQVFYRMVTAGKIGKIGKTENEYNSTVVRLLSDMRRNGDVPFSWIADNTRWMRKPRTYSSLRSMLEITASAYRRAIWNDQDAYIEIWLEKDALAGVIYDITSRWDVPLMVTRGYPSLTFLYQAAEYIGTEDREVYLYYFGDRDPSGVDIPRVVEDRLREFAPDADISFTHVAITPDQVRRWNLPTRPTKKTDTRSKAFKGDSVELDAIPPHELRDLVEGCIIQHIDIDIFGKTKIAEESERDLLERWDEVLANVGAEGGVQ